MDFISVEDLSWRSDVSAADFKSCCFLSADREASDVVNRTAKLIKKFRDARFWGNELVSWAFKVMTASNR